MRLFLLPNWSISHHNLRSHLIYHSSKKCDTGSRTNFKSINKGQEVPMQHPNRPNIEIRVKFNERKKQRRKQNTLVSIWNASMQLRRGQRSELLITNWSVTWNEFFSLLIATNRKQNEIKSIYNKLYICVWLCECLSTELKLNHVCVIHVDV